MGIAILTCSGAIYHETDLHRESTLPAGVLALAMVNAASAGESLHLLWKQPPPLPDQLVSSRWSEKEHCTEVLYTVYVQHFSAKRQNEMETVDELPEILQSTLTNRLVCESSPYSFCHVL